MLLGFLCKDEADWIDLRRRVAELAKEYKAIFSIQDEPPSWPSDSEMGLESISEPDDIDIDSDGEGELGHDDNDEEQFFDTRSATPSTSSASAKGGKRGKSEENDTEDDPVDPITPGPNSKFDLPERPPEWADATKDDNDYVGEEGAFDDDIEDDWVDPSVSSPSPQSQPTSLPRASSASPTPVSDPGPSAHRAFEVPPPPSISTSKSSAKKKKSKKGETPVPVPSALPFPVTQRSPDDVGQPDERSRTSSIRAATSKAPRMHTARARDGGRTQSGGVKGILTDS
ncbi:hypothetical protein ONZ45_g16824 [Pleurotus djamor]|nr:hypothetical protein ONZ45_g16824 [Pleurotus djamor]